MADAHKGDLVEIDRLAFKFDIRKLGLVKGIGVDSNLDRLIAFYIIS